MNYTEQYFKQYQDRLRLHTSRVHSMLEDKPDFRSMPFDELLALHQAIADVLGHTHITIFRGRPATKYMPFLNGLRECESAMLSRAGCFDEWYELLRVSHLIINHRIPKTIVQTKRHQILRETMKCAHKFNHWLKLWDITLSTSANKVNDIVLKLRETASEFSDWMNLCLRSGSKCYQHHLQYAYEEMCRIGDFHDWLNLICEITDVENSYRASLFTNFREVRELLISRFPRFGTVDQWRVLLGSTPADHRHHIIASRALAILSNTLADE